MLYFTIKFPSNYQFHAESNLSHSRMFFVTNTLFLVVRIIDFSSSKNVTSSRVWSDEHSFKSDAQPTELIWHGVQLLNLRSLYSLPKNNKTTKKKPKKTNLSRMIALMFKIIYF